MSRSRSPAAAGAMTTLATDSELVQWNSLPGLHFAESLLRSFISAGDCVEELHNRRRIRRSLLESRAQQRASAGPAMRGAGLSPSRWTGAGARRRARPGTTHSAWAEDGPVPLTPPGGAT